MTNATDTVPGCLDHHSRPRITIEDILSIWPTLASVAKATSAGDLISLSRTSRSVRSITHAFEHEDPPRLNIGHQETPQWTLIKSVATFTCISPTHKDPKSISSSPDHSRKSRHPIRPCNFCSRPICRTCIVRSFFADPTQSRNTFKHRTRHLCMTCWDKGNLRKDYRYPLHASTSSREHIWRGQNYALRGQRCTCSASEDNWLCHPCRALQNESGPFNGSFLDVESRPIDANSESKAVKNGPREPPATEVLCYGLDCTNKISLSDSSRDRRRICLWCSRPLSRPFGGEDRLRYDEKIIAIRNANAASRSADIAEWARNRFRSLTMSRREIRGPESSDSDERIFVKHLDAVNYRALVGEAAAPTPEDVYNSKHGRWRYKPAFLSNPAFWERNKARLVGKVWVEADKNILPPDTVTPEQLFAVTSEGALSNARRNRDLPRRLDGAHNGVMDPHDEQPRTAIVRLAIQFLNTSLMTKQECYNLMAGRYEVREEQHWEDILTRMYDRLTIHEVTSDGDVAFRDGSTTFGEILKEKGVVLNSKVKKTHVQGDDMSDSKAGPSTVPLEGSGATTSQDIHDLGGPSEDNPWNPSEPPPGSPPSFAASIGNNVSSN